MSLDPFHPVVAGWFRGRFGAPTEPQALAWPAIREGRHTLIAAPTGSGKTLAAFLGAIDALVRQGLDAGLPDATQVVYVSPLKALSNDIQRNLEEPLGEIRAALAAAGRGDVEIRASVRTGDTPASARAAMRRTPPHILVTTPESLYILLTSEGGREMLARARTLIVDEIHAVVGGKRGAHLALTMERLEDLAGRSLQRIGVSATQRPIETVARFLVGEGGLGPDGAPDCRMIDVGHRRDLDLGIEVPGSPLESVMAGEVWEEVYDRLASLARGQRTTLIFVNTRKLAERVARHLGDRIGEELVAAHHGSLSREARQSAERRLKAGGLRALVATASLELGIDIGTVDLVCQIGSTRSIAAFLQRAGRSGHALGRTPRCRLFPTSRDELVESAALLDAVRRGELESLTVPPWPRDILAQQIVAAVASREWSEDELFDRVRRAYPYRDLTRAAFDDLVEMLAGGFHTARGRRATLIHHDAVNRRLRARRGSRLAAITSGGAIPDNADYRVILEPGGTFLGTLNEDFAIESQAGDIFQLGNLSWRILRVEQGRVLVADAGGAPPTIPFWLGEAPSRSPELSDAVSRLREAIDVRLSDGEEAATDWLRETIGLAPAAAEQIVAYLAAARAALGRLPTRGHLVLERFFDEAGDQHVVIHAPFGGRLNRAWGLALRKRMCRTFNFELQAAATEDAILMSLGPTHSFPPEDLFRMVPAESARTLLAQAILDAPMFPIRWRWTVTRALAVLRFRAGRRVPPRLQRMQAEDLAAVAFPDQLACLENVAGNREIPDHPLVQEAMRDCLEEACDATGLESLLRSLGSGEVRFDVRELREPSPLAHEIVNARPYAFLDDAPLEERRTQAVHLRRFLDAATAADLGSLDAAVIERIRREAWPEARSADELHDGLLMLGAVTADEARAGDWEILLARLATDGRAALMTTPPGQELWVAAERLPLVRAVHPGAPNHPEVRVPERHASRTWGGAEALVELLRSRLQGLGPATVQRLAHDLGLPPERVETALGALEGEGFALRGRFTLGATETEWCERGLLARIHRGTLDRLRREIRPVAPATFLRFLLEWQRLAPGEQARGPEGLEAVLDQLEGYVAAAGAWEDPILASRVAGYDPAWLDGLCLSGRIVWGRARPAAATDGRGAGPIRTTPIAILSRESLGAWMVRAPGPDPGSEARQIEDLLQARGACFFAEIVAACGLLPARAEAGLAELVGRGRVTSDTFTGLRALLLPSSRRRSSGAGRRRTMGPRFGMDHAGRWSLLRPEPHPEAAEPVARALLRRYGVLFRALLEREGPLPPWRELVRVLRRLEARGEIRGGRFVDGFTGEQYARPDALAGLREVRRRAPAQDLVTISGADPTNLVGIVTPGDRVPSQPGNRILLRDGTAVAVRLGGTVTFLEDPGAGEATVRQALRRRITPSALRPFPGRRRP